MIGQLLIGVILFEVSFITDLLICNTLALFLALLLTHITLGISCLTTLYYYLTMLENEHTESTPGT